MDDTKVAGRVVALEVRAEASERELDKLSGLLQSLDSKSDAIVGRVQSLEESVRAVGSVLRYAVAPAMVGLFVTIAAAVVVALMKLVFRG